MNNLTDENRLGLWARASAECGGRRWLVAMLAVSLGASLFLLSQTPRPCDDAYITFRHVRNLDICRCCEVRYT